MFAEYLNLFFNDWIFINQFVPCFLHVYITPAIQQYAVDNKSDKCLLKKHKIRSTRMKICFDTIIVRLTKKILRKKQPPLSSHCQCNALYLLDHTVFPPSQHSWSQPTPCNSTQLCSSSLIHTHNPHILWFLFLNLFLISLYIFFVFSYIFFFTSIFVPFNFSRFISYHNKRHKVKKKREKLIRFLWCGNIVPPRIFVISICILDISLAPYWFSFGFAKQLGVLCQLWVLPIRLLRCVDSLKKLYSVK